MVLRPSLDMVRAALASLRSGLRAKVVFARVGRPMRHTWSFEVQRKGRRWEVRGAAGTTTVATPAEAERLMSSQGRRLLLLFEYRSPGSPAHVVYRFGAGAGSAANAHKAAATVILAAMRASRDRRRTARATFARAFRNASTETRGAGRPQRRYPMGSRPS